MLHTASTPAAAAAALQRTPLRASRRAAVAARAGGYQSPAVVELRRLLTGKATRLESQFRLTYGMILNLLRVEVGGLNQRPN
jgi:hypothetical protein